MTAIRLFVYGTLKVGQRAHAELCLSAIDARHARVRGRLHDSGNGYPELVVADEDVLAGATASPAEDAALQDRVVPLHVPEGSVHGEILDCPDPRILVDVDAYEGFAPGEAPTRFRRVLLAVTPSLGPATTAWAYVVATPSGPEIPAGRWP